VVLYDAGGDPCEVGRQAYGYIVAGVKDVKILNGDLAAWKKAGFKAEKKKHTLKKAKSFGKAKKHLEYWTSTETAKAKLGSDPNRVLTFYEPTCGAGGLIVASIDALNEAGVNYSWNAFVDCGDIDPRCVHMTYVTLSLLGVPAVVRLGDALMMEYRQNWFTPAYLMAWPHFKKQIGRGKYPNSATVPKSSEPPENAPEPPKQETREPVPAIAETVPTMDTNGQYSLF
jgi:hypothetical protein